MKNFIHKNLNFWKKGVSKSVAIIWFVSYLSIFLLPFLSGMFVHFESFNILTNQIRKMSDQIISVEQNEITRLYNMCNSTYVSICSNNTVQRLAAMDDNEELSGYTAYELKEELEDMLWNQNYIISDIWLIFNNIEYGISTSRAEPLNEFYTAESTFENGVIVYDENAYPGSLIKTSTGFAYYNIIESSSLDSSVSVYFMVDEEVMRERYKTDSFGEHGIMLFYNPDGQLIFSSTDVNDTIVEESLKILEEDKTITIGDSEYIVTTSSLYKNILMNT